MRKIWFRFFSCLFVIYIFPFPFDFPTFFLEPDAPFVPGFLAWYLKLFDSYASLWHRIVPWFGNHLLRIKTPITIFTNGSGDTTYDYLLLLVFATLAFLVTSLWTLLDRRRKSYRTALYWLRVLVRFNLGAFMLTYGFSKIYHLQMPGLYLSDLVMPFGFKSPMGLAWSFVGYSPAFSAFTGWGEVIGGALLFMRRTTSLGAIILVAVLCNVVVINFCYDVPAKLFSSMILGMDFFLLVPQIRRLYYFFILNRSTEPAACEFSWDGIKIRRLATVAKWAFILACFCGNIWASRKSQKLYGDLQPKPRYFGLYDAQTFVRNKDTLKPLTTDSTRWRRLAIQREKYSVIQFMNDEQKWMRLELDTMTGKAIFYPADDTSARANFEIYPQDSLHIVMKGRSNGDSLYVLLRKVDLSAYNLYSRGFHWISEYPFNQ